MWELCDCRPWQDATTVDDDHHRHAAHSGREVGAVWPHKNGTGFDLVLVDQISVSGRIVCTERKEKAAGEVA
jgi:hypothetical protein